MPKLFLLVAHSLAELFDTIKIILDPNSRRSWTMDYNTDKCSDLYVGILRNLCLLVSKQFLYRLFKRVLYILNKTVLVLKAKIFRWISSRTLIYGIQKRAVLLKHAFLASAFKLCCKHFLFRLASRSRWIWTTHHGTRI